MTATSFATSAPASAALFNPAFMAALIASGAIGHREVSHVGLPFELAFLVAPLALHEGTRTALPGNISGRMSRWVLDNPVLAAQLPDRASSFVSGVRAGLRYGVRASAFDTSGGLITTKLPRGRLTSLGTRDTQDCLHAARFAGRWFARTGDPYTIFALFGVRP